MMDTEKSYLKKVMFEMGFGIWGKFQQLAFGERGFRQGAQRRDRKAQNRLGVDLINFKNTQRIAAGV